MATISPEAENWLMEQLIIRGEGGFRGWLRAEVARKMGVPAPTPNRKERRRRAALTRGAKHGLD